MKPLEDMTIGHRIALTFVIVLVILFALALVGFLSGRWDEAPAAEPLKLFSAHPAGICGDEHMHEEIRAIMLGGLNGALQDRAQSLLEVWLKDDTGQPRRAANGLFQAINAYVVARVSIEKWELPRC
jgi:hypothetical protein